MSDNLIVLDLETQKTFDEVGRNNLHKLKVSVVGIYDYLDGQYKVYEEPELLDLEQRLKTADAIIGFNIRRFDMAVLAPYFISPIDSFPVFDIMEEIEKVRGHRVSLQSVAQGTLGIVKSGQGLGAVAFFQQGRMDELKKYCLDDVRITKDVYEYGRAKKKLFFISTRDWQKYEVACPWQEVRVKEAAFPTTLF